MFTYLPVADDSTVSDQKWNVARRALTVARTALNDPLLTIKWFEVRTEESTNKKDWLAQQEAIADDFQRAMRGSTRSVPPAYKSVHGTRMLLPDRKPLALVRTSPAIRSVDRIDHAFVQGHTLYLNAGIFAGGIGRAVLRAIGRGS